MSTKGKHIHVIDGKTVEYEDATCPYCHPERQQRETTEFPSCYRKGDTVVVRVSKGVMMTTTYWKDKNVILHSIQRMQRDDKGKVILDSNKQPLWAKVTTRLSMAIVDRYLMELSKLVRDVTQKTDVPKRE